MHFYRLCLNIPFLIIISIFKPERNVIIYMIQNINQTAYLYCYLIISFRQLVGFRIVVTTVQILNKHRNSTTLINIIDKYSQGLTRFCINSSRIISQAVFRCLISRSHYCWILVRTVIRQSISRLIVSTQQSKSQFFQIFIRDLLNLLFCHASFKL